MLPVHVQVVDDDVWVSEMTVTCVAVQRFPSQPEHGDDQSHDPTPQETSLHYELHEPRHLVCEVESINGQPQKWRNYHRANRTAVL